MSDKTWLKIKCGLLDPKHRERMGVRIWLFLHMVDIVDWETGVIENWKDAEQAEEFGMEYRTLQSQRQQLEKDGYITCEQTFQSQRITIHNWTNPREYSGKVYNKKGDGTTPHDTPVSDGTKKRVPIPTEKRVPHQYRSQFNHKEGTHPNFDTIELPQALRLPEIALFREITGRTPGIRQIPIIWEVIREQGFTKEQLLPFWRAWVTRGYRPENLSWLTEWAVNNNVPGSSVTVQGAKPAKANILQGMSPA